VVSTTPHSCAVIVVNYVLIANRSGTLSLSPNGKFAATFGLSNYFEVRELKSGIVQSMQWRPSKAGAKLRATGVPLEAQLAMNQPVCFAHQGFAVAGTAGGACVYVWDAERGDQLLSLNHGGKLRNISLVIAILKTLTEGSKVCALVVR
jgi:hypothetical protein